MDHVHELYRDLTEKYIIYSYMYLEATIIVLPHPLMPAPSHLPILQGNIAILTAKFNVSGINFHYGTALSGIGPRGCPLLFGSG